MREILPTLILSAGICMHNRERQSGECVCVCVCVLYQEYKDTIKINPECIFLKNLMYIYLYISQMASSFLFSSSLLVGMPIQEEKSSQGRTSKSNTKWRFPIFFLRPTWKMLLIESSIWIPWFLQAFAWLFRIIGLYLCWLTLSLALLNLWRWDFSSFPQIQTSTMALT